MVNVCFYFQVHQPFRIRKYSIFDIENNHDYFNEKNILKLNNEAILRKVSNKCYLPANKIMLKLLENHPEFKISYSITGTALEQFEKYYPEVIESFQKLIDTKRVELLSETYYHSLSYLYSKKEFLDQINMHSKKINKLFNIKPQVFRNTELIYNNEIAKFIENLNYKAILAEGWENYLNNRSPNVIYSPIGCNRIRLLLKNYKLSDDIAFRFSNKNWKEYPLTIEKYVSWINSVKGNCINLFMDYETLGEHQWEDTGIFEFIEKLPKELLKNKNNDFKTPSEIAKLKPQDVLDIPSICSWADSERDVSAWLGNKMQQEAITRLYTLEKLIKGSNNKQLLEKWRKLQTSDHFYYMCTKWFNDGDVHKYFNPYESPYDAYIAFMNVLDDVESSLKKEEVVRGAEKE
ncbi:glycoside hydrolase family 57 protein [Candidatus Woesearchaeota archaeon]|nr:glycoside hydrolase family 57 protein [Candidatus Woesearchaeota archaeon]